MCKIFLKGGGWRVQVLQVCVRDVQMCIRCSSKMHKVLRYSVFIMVCEVFMYARCSCVCTSYKLNDTFKFMRQSGV